MLMPVVISFTDHPVHQRLGSKEDRGRRTVDGAKATGKHTYEVRLLYQITHNYLLLFLGSKRIGKGFPFVEHFYFPIPQEATFQPR